MLAHMDSPSPSEQEDSKPLCQTEPGIQPDDMTRQTSGETTAAHRTPTYGKP